MICLYEYGSVLSEAGGVRLRLHVRAADKGECGNCFSVVTYNESSLCQNKYPAGIIVDNKTANSEDADTYIFIRVSCTWGQWRG